MEKNGFEREEEDVEDGFIPIHPIAKKERKKKGLKEKKRTVRIKKWVLGNKLIDLSMGDRVFIKWEMNIVVFISWVMNIMK